MIELKSFIFQKDDMTKIGLEKTRAEVAEYDPGWPEVYKKEAAIIKGLLGDLAVDIQHVGSTSVPGLPAKPVIDIGVAVRIMDDIPEIIEILKKNGYVFEGDWEDEGGIFVVKESAPGVRTLHVHIVGKNDIQWNNYIIFRDALRNEDEIRDQYLALKKELAEKYSDDRVKYTSSKHDFIRGILKDKGVEF